MRILFVVISLLIATSFSSCTNGLQGQPEKPASKLIADKFQALYNSGQYDSIFAMFNAHMKAVLPSDKTNEFLTGVKAQSGNIIQKQFIKYENAFASYKTNFERGTCALNISLDDKSKINGLFIKPYTDESLPKIKRNSTRLKLPFNGEWTIFWGGDTKELNQHVDVVAQKNAFDILIKDDQGKTHKGEGEQNDDYYAFGKEIIAPCDGEVVISEDTIHDNIPGVENPAYLSGNHVIIRTSNNEYLVFCHFKQNSVRVKQGQKIKQREILGLCGNSGNSSEPHLHFHIQNAADLYTATGVKCYFDTIMVNGKVMTDYSPIKGDKVSNK